MPFVLKSAPEVFQALVNDMLCDMLKKYVFVYLDDIFIFSQTWQKHTQHVWTFLQRHLGSKLFVKAEKCKFHCFLIGVCGFCWLHSKEPFQYKGQGLPLGPADSSYVS